MDYRILPQDFYITDRTEKIAQNLLGKILVRNFGKYQLSGMIVETEAYLQNDPACHASRGKTERTAPMFVDGGISYVYLIYGMYYCYNVVTQLEGVGEAVLIRALEPINGIDLMYENRGGVKKVKKLENLTNGPGKLAQALIIDKKINRIPVYDQKEIFVAGGVKISDKDIVNTTRIGISEGKDQLLRFYIKNNSFVSKI